MAKQKNVTDPNRTRLKKKLNLQRKAQKSLDDKKALAARMEESAMAAFNTEADPVKEEIDLLQKQLSSIVAKHQSRLSKKLQPVQFEATKLGRLLDKLEPVIDTLKSVIRGDDLNGDEDDLDAQLAKLDPEDAASEAMDDALTEDREEPYPDDDAEEESDEDSDDDPLADLDLDE